MIGGMIGNITRVGGCFTINGMLRVLRYAACLVAILACAGMAVLWARSYRVADGSWSGKPYASLHTVRGLVIVRFTGNPLVDPIRYGELWQRWGTETVEPGKANVWYVKESVLGFAWRELPPGATWISFPIWAACAATGLAGAVLACGRRMRFSLRGALIGMTVVAVVLGGVAMAMR
jgi:hypothetical protein